MDKRLSITSDGTLRGTRRVLDGQELHGIHNLTVEVDADKTRAQDTLRMGCTQLNFEGDVWFAIEHPVQGGWRGVRAIQFDDGTAWAPTDGDAQQDDAPLRALLATWQAGAHQALPADAMLINRHVRELSECLQGREQPVSEPAVEVPRG
ncbi:MAG TPA: hypothetical protein VGC24_03715 [Burkholderiaceae bacterium]